MIPFKVKHTWLQPGIVVSREQVNEKPPWAFAFPPEIKKIITAAIVLNR
jgi:hypothetical protein